MGGVVDGGAGIGIKTSPRRAAIEKAQAKLRQEYDVREERRRELEFLEKGGNPLDFKFGNAISVSVQSTSQTDRHHEPFVSCEAKGSFALTASPCGDSFESSGRPGKPAPFEPNSADNLLLFDTENDLLEKENDVHNGRKNNSIVSKQALHTDGSRNPKESDDSAIFRPYARRNRSRTNRDAARSSSTDIHGRGGHGSSLPSHPGLRGAKGSLVETTNQKEQNAQKSKFACTNGDAAPKTATSETHATAESGQNLESNAVLEQRGSPVQKMDAATKSSMEKQSNFHSDGNAQETLVHAIAGGNDLVKGDEEISSVSPADLTVAARIAENDTSNQLNGSDNLNRDDRCIRNEFQNSSGVCTSRELDNPSTNATSSVADVKKDGLICTDTTNGDSNGFTGVKVSETYRSQELADANLGEEQNKKFDGGGCGMENDQIFLKNDADNGEVAKVEDTDPQEELKHCSVNAKAESGDVAMESERIQRDLVESNSDIIVETSTVGRCQKDHIVSDETARREQGVAPDLQSAGDSSKYRDKAYEDSVLEEARTIRAKRKRIAELAVSAIVFENRRRSHWHYVLEEMAWLANDFAQERLWKMTAAAQLCHQIASKSQMRIQERIQQSKSRKLACTLAKAVVQFWQSAKAVANSGDGESFGPKVCRDGNTDGLEQKKDLEQRKCILPIQEYAVRFSKENNSQVPGFDTELSTSTIVSDSDLPDIPLEGRFTEENLFYTVPFGAMETYRKFIEAYVIQGKKPGSSIQEEANTSMFDVVGDSGYQGSACDEDDGETSTYHIPGTYDSIRPSKFSLKKRKNPMVSLPYGHTGIGIQPSIVIGKRPANLNAVPIPTKGIRSASRPRVILPFNAGTGNGALSQVKTDASSGDTSSFQDDQSTVHGGSVVQKGVEVESTANFEKHLLFDYAETPTKSKKRKKIKYPGSSFEQSWQMDSAGPTEQRGQSKRRFENHQFDYDGSNGPYGSNPTKKTKMIKQPIDNALDNILPAAGSIPSPATSQMSNLPNSNKLIRIGGRDRPKKAKMLKTPSAQPGTGSLWSQFEDQALVVLVHDMGPNWELVSDIMNDILQFKYIFRKARECKERHKFLMDKTNGDGADSAEDSGSSQSYPSTLPGIPKGSARQLFQRLQGPVEEETIKGHFEKIIQIGQKQYQRKIQSENREPKQMAVHSSHFVALSQVCPNNLNGVLLTPLDLCDAIETSPEFLPLGYPSSQASNLALSNQGAVPSMFTPSNVNSSLLGPSGIALGNNLLPSSGPLNPSMRDGRYNVQRTPPSPADEQHRMQPYNQAIPSRPVQHANAGTPSGADRGTHMMPNGNSMGLARSMPMARPGFPGIAGSSALNSSSMIASGVVGMSGSMNIHTSSSSPQGGSMLRPREGLHMVRPGHNSEQQRKMMLPDIPMQVTQGNAQGISQYNAGSPAFSNQTSPPVQMYPGHLQQPHQMPQQSHTMTHPHHPQLQGSSHPGGPQQQAYAIRLAKERQLQQRYLQQHQQQQHPLSNSSMPHLQTQAQLPMSSSVQGSPQVQPQPSSQSVLVSPLTSSSVATSVTLQHQQKNQLPHHGLARGSQFSVSGSATPAVKQRQRQAQQQQLQQSGRQHLQQRQQAQAQQHTKYLKGMGRGNMLVHQNLGVDPSHVNGLSLPPGSLGDKELQGPVLSSGAGVSTVQSMKPLISQSPNNLHLQQQLASSSPPHLPKQNQQVPPHSDKSTDSQFPPALGQTSSSSHQAIPSTLLASNHQELPLKQQTFQKQVNQTQPVSQRMLQQNRQMNYEPPMKSQPDQAQGDHKPVNNSSQIGTSTVMPNASDDSTNKTAINPSVHSQWKVSETVHETSIPNTGNQVSTVGSPSLINPTRSETFPSSSQVLGQRHLSDGFNPQTQGVGGMGLQRQPQVKQSLGTTLSSQKLYQPQEQLVPLEVQSPQQSQQQTQQLQSGQGNMYVRPTNSKLE